MFGSLLYLILILVLINFSQEPINPLFISNKLAAHTAAALSYGFILSLIALQTKLFKRIQRSTLLSITNCELLLFLVLFHFVFSLGYFWHSSRTLPAFITLFLYFGGLAVFYISWAHSQKFCHPFSFAWQPLRFLIPFTFPYLLFSLVWDGLFALNWISDDSPIITTYILFLSLIGLLFLFSPFLFRKVWGCRPLPHGELKKKLLLLCQRTSFKHGGLLVWPLMKESLTAAIIGIVFPFRYILFSPQILSFLKPEEVEAVLAHEIGHSKHKHLLFYPLLLIGLCAILALSSLLLEPAILDFLGLQAIISHKNEMHESLWFNLIQFLIYGTIVVLYMRFVMGFFSRNFERQADLYPLSFGLAPQAMIQALDRVGTLDGAIHKKKNWHHFSIGQRIQFLQQAAEYPRAITLHNQKVSRMKKSYLTIACLLSYIALAPLSSFLPYSTTISSTLDRASQTLSFCLNNRQRHHLIENRISYLPIQVRPQAKAVLQKSLLDPPSNRIKGFAEFIAAQYLLRQDEVDLAAYLLNLAWQLTDFQLLGHHTMLEFNTLTAQVLKSHPTEYSEALQALKSQVQQHRNL